MEMLSPNFSGDRANQSLRFALMETGLYVLTPSAEWRFGLPIPMHGFLALQAGVVRLGCRVGVVSTQTGGYNSRISYAPFHHTSLHCPEGQQVRITPTDVKCVTSLQVGIVSLQELLEGESSRMRIRTTAAGALQCSFPQLEVSSIKFTHLFLFF